MSKKKAADSTITLKGFCGGSIPSYLPLPSAPRVDMGEFASRYWFIMFPAKEYKIVVFGLDNADKTTKLYKIHLGEFVTTHPTVGSNVEELAYKNIRVEVTNFLENQILVSRSKDMNMEV